MLWISLDDNMLCISLDMLWISLDNVLWISLDDNVLWLSLDNSVGSRNMKLIESLFY